MPSSAAVVYPKCPHCGGEHWGQRFDDCPYVALLADPAATSEQKANAADWLRLLGSWPKRKSTSDGSQ
jgi:hypothetical protein